MRNHVKLINVVNSRRGFSKGTVLYQNFLLAQGSVLNSMYRSGLVDKLVTHANMKGLGRTPSLGDRRGFMPLQLKTNKQDTFKKIKEEGDMGRQK